MKKVTREVQEKVYGYYRFGAPVIIGNEARIKELVEEMISLEDSTDLEEIARYEEIDKKLSKSKGAAELAQKFYRELS